MGRRKKPGRTRGGGEAAGVPLPRPGGRTGAFWVLGCAALALTALAYLHYSWWPQRKAEAELALVRERAFFAFGSHVTADDFADLRPALDRFMADAQVRGAHVAYFLEGGGIEPPVDPATRRSYRPAVWSSRLTRDPVFADRWLNTCKKEMRTFIDTVLSQDRIDASKVHPDMAGFLAAQHAFLATHRERIADIQFENLSVEDILADLRLQVLQENSFLAYVRGRFAEYRNALVEYQRTQSEWVTARDTAFVGQIARYLEKHPDRLVLTFRGSLHWPSTRRFGLRGELSPRTSNPEAEYGPARVGMMRVMGATLGQEEDMRVALAHVPGHLLQQYWMKGPKRWSGRQATDAVARVFNHPSFTAGRAEALSRHLSQFDWDDSLDPRYGEAVHRWLKQQGLLPPD